MMLRVTIETGSAGIRFASRVFARGRFGRSPARIGRSTGPRGSSANIGTQSPPSLNNSERDHISPERKSAGFSRRGRRPRPMPPSLITNHQGVTVLIITVDLVSGGFEPARRTIASMHVSNLSNLAAMSDYRVDLLEAPNPLTGTPARIASREVKGHDRMKALWAPLAKKRRCRRSSTNFEHGQSEEAFRKTEKFEGFED